MACSIDRWYGPRHAPHQRHHDLSRVLRDSTLAEHSGEGGRGRQRRVPHRGPATVHPRPTSHGRRLSIWWRGGNGDEARPVLRGGRVTRSAVAHHPAVATWSSLLARRC